MMSGRRNGLRIGRWGLLLALVLASVASGVAASSASASFVYQRSGGCNPAPCDDSDLVYAGTNGEGESNNVQVTRSGGTFRFVEMAPGTEITSVYEICTQVSAVEVTCPTTWDYGTEVATFDVDAELHDGDDQIDMRTNRPAEIDGGAGSDVLRGGTGNDTILGDLDFATPAGPDGNDFIDGRAGADRMQGDGGGSDTVSYASRSTAVNVSLDGAANDGGFGEGDNATADVEIVRATDAGDTLTGNNSANQLVGRGGFDLISGLGGPDTLEGGDAGDRLEGGAGNDTVRGEGGGDNMFGGADPDVLDGGTEDDTLAGEGGADDMFGGPGGADTVHYTDAAASVTVRLDNGANDGTAGEGDNARTDIERVVGGQFNDFLEAQIDGGNELWGAGGNDTLIGSGQFGDDRLEGQDGDDTLDGWFGADVMNGGGGVDAVDYTGHCIEDQEGNLHGVSSTPNGAGDDGNFYMDRGELTGGYDNVGSDVENVFGSCGPDNLVGTTDSNRLLGRGEDDVVAGDASNDVLLGGDGDDTLSGQSGNDSIDGGIGADDMDGGADTDIAMYASRSADLLVRIDDIANDGEAAVNESDNVRQTIENVRGGTGADTLIGSNGPNNLVGESGNDILNGRLGADILNGQDGIDTITYADRSASVAVILDGAPNDGADPDGSGRSTPAEEGDRDRDIEIATGGVADDRMVAPIADAVVNVLRGGDGDDTLHTREGTPTVDRLVCGAGSDRFLRDASDLPVDCEIEL